jgi:hypothetical protein
MSSHRLIMNVEILNCILQNGSLEELEFTTIKIP